jgi:single-strand DNA-binding protein
MIIGNLENDPEMRYTANGNAVTTFRVGVNRVFEGESERREVTDWFRVVTWNKLAETAQAHLSKGRKVFVEGRLATRTWDDADGQKHYMTETIANNLLVLDRPTADPASYEEEFPSEDGEGLNRVMLIGNLGRDPEMRFTANGSAVTTISVAVNRNFSGEGDRREETEWFRVVAWNKLAELVQSYLQKGQRVYVEGRLSTRSWEGQDGQRRYTTEVVANQVLFLDRPRGAGFPDTPGDIDPDDLPFDSP